MRLYHFLSSEHAFSSIALQRIKVSTVNDVNDPFEFEPYVAENGNVRAQQLYDKRVMNSKTGFLCFCKSWDSPASWAHYAQRHTGICLGFNVPKQQVRRITYFHKRPNLLNENDLSFDQIETDVLFSKARDWAYEKEWRYCISLDDCQKDNGLFFLPFSPYLELCEVILGVKCGYLKQTITKLISSQPKAIVVRKAGKSESDFKIVEDHFYKEP